MPAVRHSSMAPTTSSRSGSIIPVIPTKMRSFSTSSISPDTVSVGRYAIASTLRADSAILRFLAWRSSMSLSVISLMPSAVSIFVQTESTSSRPPFTLTWSVPSCILLIVDILFLVESNATSPSRGQATSRAALFTPFFSPRSMRAISVGSPTLVVPPSWLLTSFASQQSTDQSCSRASRRKGVCG